MRVNDLGPSKRPTRGFFWKLFRDRLAREIRRVEWLRISAAVVFIPTRLRCLSKLIFRLFILFYFFPIRQMTWCRRECQIGMRNFSVSKQTNTKWVNEGSRRCGCQRSALDVLIQSCGDGLSFKEEKRGQQTLLMTQRRDSVWQADEGQVKHTTSNSV